MITSTVGARVLEAVPPGITVPRDRPGAVALLKDVLSDDAWLGRVAGASYRHANGFDKLVIASERGRYMVKFDVWWAEEPGVEEAPHNHRWDFVSEVLIGGLRVWHYEVVQGGRGFYRYKVHGFGVGRHDEFERLDEVGLAISFQTLLPQGTRYFLHHRQLHSVAGLPGVTTVTVGAQGPTAQERSEMIDDRASRPVIQQTSAFAIEQVREKLTRIVALLTDT